jgi:acyl-CoA thioesterase-1
MKTRQILLITMLLLLWSCDPSGGTRPVDLSVIWSASSTIVCFGDSLTAGYGSTTPATDSYPALLQARVTLPVINAGIRGDTSGQGLARLQADVLDHDPVIVIIEFGANDYFIAGSGIDMAAVENNFRTMLSLLEDGNRKIYVAKFYTYDIAQDMLGGDMTLYYEFENMFGRLAADFDITLINDIWGPVWDDPDLRPPAGVHPNTAGYTVVEGLYYQAIKAVIEYNGMTVP